MGELTTTFLSDGAQPAAATADALAAWIGAAATSLDVAIYDFDAKEGASARIADALEAALRRGVAVRVVFNTERTDDAGAARPMHADPATIEALDVPTRGVADEGALMHHKYVVRDGRDVWTGSTNWTDDAFTREENVLLELAGVPDIAAAYTENFEHLWAHGHLERSGATGPEVQLDQGVRAQPLFSPAPPWLSLEAARMIAAADRRVRLCSPVVTSGAVLAVLAEHVGREKLGFTGAFDATQMEQVQRQWADVPHNRWKIEVWRTIAPHLSGKISTPYEPGSVHDYMHAKILVVDDEVLTGSFNFSRNGEENAENVLHLVSEDLAVRFTGFVEAVSDRYRAGGAQAQEAPRTA
ncbi:MAG TPA: phospholipase D-like domain-containing protein [Actinomycetota bacterium]|nr:phospholipase D-like domain-containing protein [Actinomycetota bacterium]